MPNASVRYATCFPTVTSQYRAEAWDKFLGEAFPYRLRSVHTKGDEVISR